MADKDRFKIKLNKRDRPVLEPDDSSDEDKPKKPIIVPMSQSVHSKKAAKTDDGSKKRLSNFLSQFNSNAEGRFEPGKIVVDDIKKQFDSADIEHLNKFKPPGASTPTDDESLTAWNFKRARSQAQAELYADPLVRFVLNVDGFIEQNNQPTRSSKTTVTLSNLYSIIASMGAQGGNQSQKTSYPMLNMSITQGGAGPGFRNIGQSHSPINVERGMFVTPPKTGDMTLDRIDSIRLQSAKRTMTDTLNRKYRSRTVGAEEGVRLFPEEITTPSQGYYEFSRAGEREEGLEGLPPVDVDLMSNQPVVAPRQQQPTPTVVPQAGPYAGATAPPAEPDILRFSQDDRYRPAVEKYLSNMRTAQAFEYMNRPEITGEVEINNTTFSCIEFGYSQLVLNYPEKFKSFNIVELFTSNIRPQLARYCSLWIDEVRSSSGNRNVLSTQWGKVKEDRCALESFIASFVWNSYTKEFEVGRPYAKTYSRSTYDDRLAINNAMFLY